MSKTEKKEESVTTTTAKTKKQPNTHLRDAILADASGNERKASLAKARLEKIKEGKL